MKINLSDTQFKIVDEYLDVLETKGWEAFYDKISSYKATDVKEIVEWFFCNQDPEHDFVSNIFDMPEIPDYYIAGSKEIQGDITLPNTVTRIGYRAFAGSSIRSIIIPDSVVYIEAEAFKDCKTLRAVRMSKNVQRLYSETFAGCQVLASIDIPESIKSIGRDCFKDCNSLHGSIYGDHVKVTMADARNMKSQFKKIKTYDQNNDDITENDDSIQNVGENIVNANSIKDTNKDAESADEIINESFNKMNRKVMVEALLSESFGEGCPDWLKKDFIERIHNDPDFPVKLERQTGININSSIFHTYDGGIPTSRNDAVIRRALRGDQEKYPVIPIFLLDDDRVYIRSFYEDDQKPYIDSKGSTIKLGSATKGDLVNSCKGFCWVNIDQQNIDDNYSYIGDIKDWRKENNDIPNDIRYKRFSIRDIAANSDLLKSFKFDKSGYIVPGLDRFEKYIKFTAYNDPMDFLNSVKNKVLAATQIYSQAYDQLSPQIKLQSLRSGSNPLKEFSDAIIETDRAWRDYVDALPDIKTAALDTKDYKMVKDQTERYMSKVKEAVEKLSRISRENGNINLYDIANESFSTKQNRKSLNEGFIEDMPNRFFPTFTI